MANKQTRALRASIHKDDVHTFTLHTNNTGALPSPVSTHNHGARAFGGPRKDVRRVIQNVTRSDLPKWHAGWVNGLPPKQKPAASSAVPASRRETVYDAKRGIDKVGIADQTGVPPVNQQKSKAPFIKKFGEKKHFAKK